MNWDLRTLYYLFRNTGIFFSDTRKCKVTSLVFFSGYCYQIYSQNNLRKSLFAWLFEGIAGKVCREEQEATGLTASSVMKKATGMLVHSYLSSYSEIQDLSSEYDVSHI